MTERVSEVNVEEEAKKDGRGRWKEGNKPGECQVQNGRLRP